MNLNVTLSLLLYYIVFLKSRTKFFLH